MLKENQRTAQRDVYAFLWTDLSKNLAKLHRGFFTNIPVMLSCEKEGFTFCTNPLRPSLSVPSSLIYSLLPRLRFPVCHFDSKQAGRMAARRQMDAVLCPQLHSTITPTAQASFYIKPMLTTCLMVPPACGDKTPFLPPVAASVVFYCRAVRRLDD